MSSSEEKTSGSVEDTTIRDLDNEYGDEEGGILYVYGTRQEFSGNETVDTLFMFNHDNNVLTVMDIFKDHDNKETNIKAFAMKFDPRDTVHQTLEPFMKQLVVVTPEVRATTEEEIQEYWNWIPQSINGYFEYVYGMEGATYPGNFSVETDPDEVPNTISGDDFLTLVECRILPLQLSGEFIADVADVTLR